MLTLSGNNSLVVGSFSANKVNLFPVLPSIIKDSRYRSAMPVCLSPTIVPLGADTVLVPSYQSQQWTVSAHPEGKRYAYIKSQTGITIVTEANISECGVSDQLNTWLSVICNMAVEKHAHIPEASHLFLEIHQDAGTCNYYFANHGLRTVFWLHTLNTIGVGLPSSHSHSYFQYSLEENYWIHVELFPGTASQYSDQALNELQVVLLHAHADDLASDRLIFPYPAKECGECIDILEHNKERASSPFVIIYVARLWEIIANHRFLTLFGKDHCRLSSDQPISEVLPNNKWGRTLAVISKMLLFGFPDHYEALFKIFWADQLVDASHWREHASEMVQDLKQTMSSILALLGASALTSSSSGLIKASSFLCTFDLAVTLYLLQRQQRLLCTKLPTSVAYLKHWNTTYGFQPIAIVHSLPQALFVWALLLFSMQGFWVVFADLPLTLCLSTLLPVTAIMVTVGLAIWFIVHPRRGPIEEATLSPPTPPNPAEEQREVPTVESIV